MSEKLSKTEQSCTTHSVMRWLGFTGHKWSYNGAIRTCKRCGEKQRLLDYEAYCTIWGKF